MSAKAVGISVNSRSQPTPAPYPTGVRRIAHLVGKQRIGEINPCYLPETVEAPSPCVHVEDLVRSVSRILLKLNFGKSIKTDGPQKSLREFLNFGDFGCFNVSGSPAKFARILSQAPGDQAAVRPSIAKKTLRRKPGGHHLRE
jgi:hypothetical protein